MKNIVAASLIAIMGAGSAIAGGLSPVVVEEEVVVEKAASSVSPLLILGLLVLIGVLISRDNDEPQRGG